MGKDNVKIISISVILFVALLSELPREDTSTGIEGRTYALQGQNNRVFHEYEG
ncbi:MAG TPA: hypothetical protein VFS97_05290 [Nitrososphaeraceae archaeon]|nr:hypothetical protein [Nitrososphaeraceae archaeon]